MSVREILNQFSPTILISWPSDDWSLVIHMKFGTTLGPVTGDRNLIPFF